MAGWCFCLLTLGKIQWLPTPLANIWMLSNHSRQIVLKRNTYWIAFLSQQKKTKDIKRKKEGSEQRMWSWTVSTWEKLDVGPKMFCHQGGLLATHLMPKIQMHKYKFTKIIIALIIHLTWKDSFVQITFDQKVEDHYSEEGLMEQVLSRLLFFIEII